MAGTLTLAVLALVGGPVPASAAPSRTTAASGTTAPAASRTAGLGLPAIPPTGPAAPSHRTPVGAGAAALVPPGVPPAVPPAVPPVVPKLVWRACGGGLRCATARVPLDHARPTHGTIALAVARLPATDARRRIGTLFVNPGGPGVAASQFLGEFADVVGPEVTKRFDLVGVDPRGVGGSQPYSCTVRVGSYGMPELLRAYPISASEVRRHLAHDDYLRRSCARANAPIKSYMSTADSARDLELVRRALGERSLTFYGLSYGSYLGLTYANLYPQRVRAIVLDGVLDPVAWAGRAGSGTRNPVSARTGSGVASWAALRRVFAECAAASALSCAPGASAADEWAAVTARLRRGPFEVDGERLYLQDLIQAVQGELYDASGIPALMWQLHEVYRAMAPGAARARATVPSGSGASAHPHGARDAVTRDRARAAVAALRAAARRAGERTVPWSAHHAAVPATSAGASRTARTEAQDMGMVGVMCSDALNPASYAAWSRVAVQQDRLAPGFGPLWTWSSSMCAGWRTVARGAYRGPFTVKPANGLLLLANTHDGPTPATGARTVRLLSPGSRLVLTDMVAHTTADASACASAVRTRYLLNGVLPRRDVSCRPDRPLFD